MNTRRMDTPGEVVVCGTCGCLVATWAFTVHRATHGEQWQNHPLGRVVARIVEAGDD